MNTWISKVRFLTFCAASFLAACDQFPVSTGTGGGTKAITQVSMARGAVQLTTPEGYCVDRRGRNQTFALIARCDTLGVIGFFASGELAVIAASTQSVDPGTTSPRAHDLANARPEDDTVTSIERESIAIVLMQSDTAQLEGVSKQYWRTAFVVNDQLVSLALYAPDDSAALTSEGARLLEETARATRAASRPTSG